MNDVDLDLVGTQIVQRVGNGLQGALNISFEHNLELLGLAFFDAVKEVIQSYFRRSGKLCFTQLQLPVSCYLFGLFLVVHHHQLITSLRHP